MIASNNLDLSQSEVEGSVDVCEHGGFLCELILEWTGNETATEIASVLLGIPIRIVLIWVVAIVITRVVRRFIRRISLRAGRAASTGTAIVSEQMSERAEARAASISTLLRSATSAVVYTVAAIMTLDLIGVSVVPVLASAGVAGIAIGFGAQRLVEDVITGLFMLIEDQFGVGDRIDIGAVNGTVEGVTLRSTVLRDADGTLWHVPNSEIRRVANESQLWSRVLVDIGVAYGTPIDGAMEALDAAAKKLARDAQWAEHVVAEPEVLGVQELGADSLDIRVITRVAPGMARQYRRELQRVLAEALEAIDVEMPNRQVDVWVRSTP